MKTQINPATQNMNGISLEAECLLTDQDHVYDKVVESIEKGIELEDEIPSISVLKIIYDEPFFHDKYIIHNGNHRALAYARKGLPVGADILCNVLLSDLYDHNICPPLKKIADLEIITGVISEKMLKEKMKTDFYR